MKRIVAALALMAAVAAVAIIGGPLLKADHNSTPSERHEEVSLAAILALPTFPAAITAIDVRKIQQAIADEWAQAHGRLAALPTFAGQAAAIVPDPTLTPGGVRTPDVGEICSTGTKQLRHWDRARDDHIMAEYGLSHEPRLSYSLSPPF
jgi:hypothetical protein